MARSSLYIVTSTLSSNYNTLLGSAISCSWNEFHLFDISLVMMICMLGHFFNITQKKGQRVNRLQLLGTMNVCRTLHDSHPKIGSRQFQHFNLDQSGEPPDSITIHTFTPQAWLIKTLNVQKKGKCLVLFFLLSLLITDCVKEHVWSTKIKVKSQFRGYSGIFSFENLCLEQHTCNYCFVWEVKHDVGRWCSRWDQYH